MRPVMIEIETNFEDAANHTTPFGRTLEDIYEKDIRRNRVPVLISAKAKYVPAATTILSVDNIQFDQTK